MAVRKFGSASNSAQNVARDSTLVAKTRSVWYMGAVTGRRSKPVDGGGGGGGGGGAPIATERSEKGAVKGEGGVSRSSSSKSPPPPPPPPESGGANCDRVRGAENTDNGAGDEK
jgi:hypothetical protein